MGLFDKLKAAKNSLTGGAASVTLELGQANRGHAVPVKITANAKAALKAKSVYVLVRGVEEATIENYQTSNGKETVRDEHIVHEIKLDVAGATEMNEGQSLVWEAQVNLPQGAGATYNGRMIRNVWKAQAGLDTFGNDPDSGWIEFPVA